MDACFLAGGEVVVPTGTYLTAGVRLRSNVTLHLMENAVLMGSIHPDMKKRTLSVQPLE